MYFPCARVPVFSLGKLLPCCLFVLSLFILSVSPAGAQLDRGGIVGTVSDLAGARVTGAKVTVTNTATNTSQVIQTNSEGNYSVNNLQIGAYSITVEKTGFKIAVENRVDVPVNQVVKVDFALSPGSESQTVEVSAAATQLQTQSSSLGTVETTQRIAALPLNGRNFIALAYLGPGANGGQAGSNAAGGVFENERADEAISVNGLRVSNNNFLLNGVDNNEFGLGRRDHPAAAGRHPGVPHRRERDERRVRPGRRSSQRGGQVGYQSGPWRRVRVHPQ